MNTQLTHIAEKAGVSTATVSRVLNGRPGVSATTRAKVNAAMDDVGFLRPVKTESATIGLIIPPLSNPIFAAFALALETEFHHLGISTLICARASGGPGEEENIRVLTKHDVDGIVFVSGVHSDLLANVDQYGVLNAQKLPYILVNGAHPQINAPVISADDKRSVEKAHSHLRQLGHQKIGFVSGPSRYIPTKRKADAFLAIMNRLNQDSPQESIAEGLYTIQGGEDAASTLLETGHTALICASDSMALGAIVACQNAGLKVPDDVSIIGFDDSPYMPYLDPPLTTMRQPVPEMAAAIASTMLNELSEPSNHANEIFFRTELIVRQSTGPYRAQ